MLRKHVPTRRRLRLEPLEDRLCLSSSPVGTSTTVPNAAIQAHLTAAYGKIPLSFEANKGQTSAQVSFLSRGNGYALFLTPTKAVLSLKHGETSNVVGMRVVGSNPTSRGVGVDKQASVSNYLIGNDFSKWHTDVPNYSQVSYKGVYRGIDLVYHGDQQQLEYDFVVAPGADPRAIRLAFDGIRSASLDRAGNLVLHTSGGDVVEHAPVAYQMIHGVQHSVSAHFLLSRDGRVGFQVSRYDHGKPLVIDPVLSYSTYLGGSKFDSGNAIAVFTDTSGNTFAYVTGYMVTDDFPTKNPLQPKNAGGADAFVTKFNTTLSGAASLIGSTYLGGSGGDIGYGIAVGPNGNVYLTGYTTSTNFPTTMNPFQANIKGSGDFFVTELNNTGTALVYSTFLGGTGGDNVPDSPGSPMGISLSTDTSGNTFAYVTGSTGSIDFPTTATAFQPVFGGGLSGTNVSDAFVAKLNPALQGAQSLVYSTYFGGNGNDYAHGIAADSAGNAYLTGYTRMSTNLPTTMGAIQPAIGAGQNDAFVAAFNSAGTGLVYCTYLGGSGMARGLGIAVDNFGNAYVTGSTGSSDFPTTTTGYQILFNNSVDAFLTKLNATGTGLLYSTYLGGSGRDWGLGVALDSSGNAYVTGYTESYPSFPTKNPFQITHVGVNQDAFVAKLNPTLSGDQSLVYSSSLGGSDWDQGTAVAVDGAGAAYVSGVTDSFDFPTTANSFQPTRKQSSGKHLNNDYAFVTKITGT